jgi:transposase
MKAGRTITRIVLAVEAARDGFWFARWLLIRNLEVHVVYSTSVAVSREHQRAKTDRLDTEMLIRVILGWLRGEVRHCKMVAVPTVEEEMPSGRAVSAKAWPVNAPGSSTA